MLKIRMRTFEPDIIGPKNIEIVRTGQRIGAGVKFPGSGGSAIGIYYDDEMFKEIKKVYSNTGCLVYKASASDENYLNNV